MAEESFEEKTEKATPRKREEAKKKGEVAKSRELASTAVLFAGLITLTLFGSYMYNHIQIIMKETFSQLAFNDLSVSDFIAFAEKVINMFILTIIPLMSAVFFTAVFSNVIQIGFVLSGESIIPKLSKLSPIKGFKRLFSKQSLMEFAKSMLKLGIIGSVAYITINGERKNALLLGDMEINSIISYILSTVFKIFFRCILAMILIVIIDFIFQKFEFEKKLKMSKKDVKDELKRSEGDPQVKSRIKSIQMEMARKRMMQAVPEADVVITNPTHLAVALKYDSAAMNAPKVIAKGAGILAERIRNVANSHGIPIVENKEMARNLYALVEIGQEVPSILYQAVAEILAYIYGLKGNYAGGLA